MHTALKIAPVYDAPVVHVKDASQNSRIAAQLLGASTCEAFVNELRQHQSALREQFASRQQDLLTLDEARRHRPTLW
jgi:5-methyltetrahydrofolate--homocysteine methyltransferase